MNVESSNFSYQNFALRKFLVLHFYGHNLLTLVCHVMLQHRILKYFHPVLDKKDPSEDKELPNPSGPLSKVEPSLSIASCKAEIMKVLKQVKWPVAKNCYTKLTSAQRYEIGKKGAEMGVTATIQYHKKFPDLSLTEPTLRQLKNCIWKN